MRGLHFSVACMLSQIAENSTNKTNSSLHMFPAQTYGLNAFIFKYGQPEMQSFLSDKYPTRVSASWRAAASSAGAGMGTTSETL